MLALVLMAVAAMPWLRSLESQRWGPPATPVTVPPPEPLAIQPSSAGQGQAVARPQDVPPSSAGETPIEKGPRPVPEANPSSPSPANGATHAPDTPKLAPPAPQILVNNAVSAVETPRFITARIKQQGELFGRQITGGGRYYELRQGPIPWVRLELTMQVGSASTSLVQVCNGTTFWKYRKMPREKSLSKIDAVRAITALEQAADRLPLDARACAPGLGGLGRLVRGLNQRFQFTTVVADQLGGLPVWKLSGGWRPQQLARVLPLQKEALEKGRAPDWSRAPNQVPDSVMLFLAQDDCFPCRIDYLRSESMSGPRHLMSLEFFELSFTGPIDSSQFLFTPPYDLEIIDRTEEFVRSLGGP